MDKSEYIDYLKSEDWKERRRYLMELADSMCSRCGEKATQLHHLNYNNLGNEELENWLLRLLNPKINFYFNELTVDSHSVVLLEISAAFRHPVQFKNTEYIRIGSYKKKLKDYPRCFKC